MTTTTVAFVIALLMAYGLTWIARGVALRLGVTDSPDRHRKLHQRRTPLLGGVPVFLAFVLTVGVVIFFRDSLLVGDRLHREPRVLCALFGGGLVALVTGLLDDILNIRARTKLLGQIAAAMVACYCGIIVSSISLPGGFTVQLGVFTYPFTILWFLGCMNSVNLMDGLDGLASGITLIIALALGLFSMHFNNAATMLLLFVFSGAVAGFLFHNFHPARIFLGDAGSLFLGYTIAFLSLRSVYHGGAAMILVPIACLALPIIDTAMAIVRRWARNLPLHAPDRQHIHHRLLNTGLSQPGTVIVLYGVCMASCVLAMVFLAEDFEIVAVTFLAICFIVYICLRVVGQISITGLYQRVRGAYVRQKLNNDAKIAVERVCAVLPRTDGVWDVWRSTAECFHALNFHHVVLRFHRGHAPLTTLEFCWTHEADPAKAHFDTDISRDEISVALNLTGKEGACFARLTAARHPEVGHFLPDSIDSLERLRPILQAELCRNARAHKPNQTFTAYHGALRVDEENPVCGMVCVRSTKKKAQKMPPGNAAPTASVEKNSQLDAGAAQESALEEDRAGFRSGETADRASESAAAARDLPLPVELPG